MPSNADYFATNIKKERKKSRTKKKKKEKNNNKKLNHTKTMSQRNDIHVLFPSFFTTGQSLCLITLLVINYSFFKNNFFILN